MQFWLKACWTLSAELQFLCVKQWQAVVFPLALTALMYAGSLTFMSLLLIHSLREDVNCRGGLIKSISVEAVASLRSIASSVMHWRNYVVVSCLLWFHTDFCLILSCKKLCVLLQSKSWIYIGSYPHFGFSRWAIRPSYFEQELNFDFTLNRLQLLKSWCLERAWYHCFSVQDSKKTPSFLYALYSSVWVS